MSDTHFLRGHLFNGDAEFLVNVTRIEAIEPGVHLGSGMRGATIITFTGREYEIESSVEDVKKSIRGMLEGRR